MALSHLLCEISLLTKCFLEATYKQIFFFSILWERHVSSCMGFKIKRNSYKAVLCEKIFEKYETYHIAYKQKDSLASSKAINSGISFVKWGFWIWTLMYKSTKKFVFGKPPKVSLSRRGSYTETKQFCWTFLCQNYHLFLVRMYVLGPQSNKFSWSILEHQAIILYFTRSTHTKKNARRIVFPELVATRSNITTTV